MTIGRTTVKTINNVEKSLSILAVLSNFQNPFNWGMICGFMSKIMGVRIFVKNFGRRTVHLLSTLVSLIKVQVVIKVQVGIFTKN